jgi:hypothetical protein
MIGPMGELADSVNEAVEKARENPSNAIVALLVAVTATFMALCNVKGGNVGQAMALDQSKAADGWAYYQAKSTKQSLAEAMADQLTVQRALLPAGAATPDKARALLDEKIAGYLAAVQRYEQEKQAIKKTAEGYEADYERLNIQDDQFDMAEALMSIAVALFGITALTGKRAMLITAIVFASVGGVLGIAGFAGWKLHPSVLARIIG